LHHPQVVDGEGVVDGDGGHGANPLVAADPAQAHIGDLQATHLPPLQGRGFATGAAIPANLWQLQVRSLQAMPSPRMAAIRRSACPRSRVSTIRPISVSPRGTEGSRRSWLTVITLAPSRATTPSRRWREPGRSAIWVTRRT